MLKDVLFDLLLHILLLHILAEIADVAMYLFVDTLPVDMVVVNADLLQFLRTVAYRYQPPVLLEQPSGVTVQVRLHTISFTYVNAAVAVFSSLHINIGSTTQLFLLL